MGGRMKPTTVYRLYDADGDLLYVGVAGNPGRRFEQHAAAKLWWGEVATTELEHHDTREDALEAERLAIIDENPRYNIVHKADAPAPAAESVEQIRGLCTSCHRIIDPPGGGFLELDISVAMSVGEAKARAESRHRHDVTAKALALINIVPAAWMAWCRSCKADPDLSSHEIDLSELTCWRDLAWQSAEVMAKRYGEHSDWHAIVRGLAAGDDGGCLRVVTGVRARPSKVPMWMPHPDMFGYPPEAAF